jgi:hypothetical protein
LIELRERLLKRGLTLPGQTPHPQTEPKDW